MRLICCLTILTIISQGYQIPQKYRQVQKANLDRVLSEDGYRTDEVVLTDSTLNGDWEPLRLEFEYIKQVSTDDFTFITTILKIAQAFLEKHLLVHRSKTDLKIPSTINSDYEINLSQSILSKSYTKDMVFLVFQENSPSEDYLAYASGLYYDPETKRPTIGMTSFNIAFIDQTKMTDAYFEMNVETAIHEILHGLGFHDELFETFYDSATGKTYPNSVHYLDGDVERLTTPRTLTYARDYFSCPSLEGLYMEDYGEGSKNGHFERTIFYNELMTPSDVNGDIVTTDFLFQFLQDTGFYRIAQYKPDPLLWGKNQGCEFAKQESCDFAEYCSTNGEKKCSFQRTGIAQCFDKDSFSSCPFYAIVENADCRDASNLSKQTSDGTFQYFGYNSMCFDGALSKTSTIRQFSCYQFRCDTSNNLSIVVDGQVFSCSKSGPVTLPTGYTGTLECPENSSVYCENFNECPQQCNKRGYCTDALCTCIQGYSGIGCETVCNGYRNGKDCVDTCPSGTFAIADQKLCLGCPANCAACSNYNKCTTCDTNYNLRGGFCDNFDESFSLNSGYMIRLTLIILVSIMI